MVFDYRHWLRHPLFLSGLTGLAIVIGMYGWVPYGMGYGSQAVSVFSNLWWMWQRTLEWEHCKLAPAIVLALIYWKREEQLGHELNFKSRDFIITAALLITFLVACAEKYASPLLASVSLVALLFQVFLGAGRFDGIVLHLDRRSVFPLLLAAFFYVIAYKIDVVQISFLSLHLSIGALVVWFFGWSFLKLILFPYVFLAFSWPFSFLDQVAFKLRVVMSSLSYLFLNLIGVDALKVGTAIVSAPDFTYGIPQGAKFSLDVADPCSGIHSLFALTMITALWSYFTQVGWWRQWTLFLCAVPLAVAGNFVRILMLTFGTLLFGSPFAIGTEKAPSTYHTLSGFVVFIVALGGMVLIGWILSGGWKVLYAVIGLDTVKWSELKKIPEAKREY